MLRLRTVLELISQEIKNFYGDDPEKSMDFARVISIGSAERITVI